MRTSRKRSTAPDRGDGGGPGHDSRGGLGQREEQRCACPHGYWRRGEVNPALGIRGIRLLLQHRGLLETQFAAILRAAMAGPVRVLLPMVSSMGKCVPRVRSMPASGAGCGAGAWTSPIRYPAGHHDRDPGRGPYGGCAGAGCGIPGHRYSMT
ncbi:putative PEP-binding protein [Komagataeibacter rhaeticus]|nr:putative PEP-binding protein [Komagataeibacter rhaeticus]